MNILCPFVNPGLTQLIILPGNFQNLKDMSVPTLISKVVILMFLGLIFFFLGSALYYLVCEGGNSEKILKALTWRILLSIALFFMLFIAFAFGWLTPHPI